MENGKSPSTSIPVRRCWSTKSTCKVDGPGATDPLFERITADPPLHAGDRLSHATYEAIKSDLQRTAATYGYLDAKLTRNELVVDPKNHTANVALEMETGERYRFGPTTIEQTSVRDALVRRYLRYHEGDYFDLTQILRTQFALDDAQYFANLEVLPQDADHQTHIIPVDIHADKSRRNRYSFGAGYATDTGVRGTLTWENRRLNTLGHRFSVTIEASQVERYLLQARYIIPIGDPAVENLTFQTTVDQLQLADITTHTQSIGPAITKVAGNWQYVLFANATKTTDDSIAGSTTERHARTRDRSRLGTERLPGRADFPTSLLRGNPRLERRDRLGLEFPAGCICRPSTSFRLPTNGTCCCAMRSAPPWCQISTGSPPSCGFFAGGDNSVRGFAFDELSPIDTVCRDSKGTSPGRRHRHRQMRRPGRNQVTQDGGKDLVTGTVEVIRDLPHNFGVATFFDYGNAFNHFGDPIEYAAGVGFRVRLPVVTLGIDIAEPLSRNAAARACISTSRRNCSPDATPAAPHRCVPGLPGHSGAVSCRLLRDLHRERLAVHCRAISRTVSGTRHSTS